MKITETQKIKISQILEQHTYPKEQLGFFTINDLINLIEVVLND